MYPYKKKIYICIFTRTILRLEAQKQGHNCCAGVQAYISIHVHIRTYVYAHTYIYLYFQTYNPGAAGTKSYIYKFIYSNIQTWGNRFRIAEPIVNSHRSTWLCIHLYIYICICICIHTYIYKCINIYKTLGKRSQNLDAIIMYSLKCATLSLQLTATNCKSLQLTATHCTSLQLTATNSTTPQHTATHCNTPGVKGTRTRTQL